MVVTSCSTSVDEGMAISDPVKNTVAAVLGFAITPFYLSAILLSLAYRFVLHLYFTLVQPGYCGLLNFIEGFFDLESGANLSVINIMCFVKPTKISSGEELRGAIIALIGKAVDNEKNVRLKCKRSERFGLRYWENVGIDLNKQIRLFEASNMDELQNYLSSVSNRPLHDDRLWEIHVSKTLLNGTYFIIMRAHHTLADGYALREILIEAQPDFKVKKSGPKRVGLIRMSYIILITMRDMIIMFLLAPSLCISQYLDPVDKNSLTAGRMSGEKVLRWRDGDFKKLKEIQKITKTTCTEILMAALSKSLDDVFKSRNESVHRVTVSFPFRRSQKTTGLSNEFIPVGLKVPVNTSRRQEDVTMAVRSLHDKPDYLINYFFPRYALMIFPMKLPEWTYRCTESTSVFSNFPGPKEKVIFESFETEGFLFFVPNLPGNNGLGVTISTYGDQLVYSVIMDRTVIHHPDDPQRIADSMVKYVDDLHRAL